MYLIWFTRDLKSAQRNMYVSLSQRLPGGENFIAWIYILNQERNFLFPKCVTAQEAFPRLP